MKRFRAHRVIPPLAAAAGVAVPVLTMFEILSGVSHGGPTASAGQVAVSASTPTSTSVATRPAPAAARAAPTATAVRAAARVYVGQAVSDQYGAVQATITVAGKKITTVSITAPQNDPRSASINSQAVPMLVSETLQAQSANVNTISGATETSNAYAQSLQSALQQAGI
ncbi:MAG TPA: FMN-binding protein [Chloroflexota bacterium]|nr:FMN-binding protein [Chloroflexota bacterium]